MFINKYYLKIIIYLLIFVSTLFSQQWPLWSNPALPVGSANSGVGLENNESARVRFNKGVEKNLILKYANLRLVGHWNATSIFKTIIQEIK